MSVTFTVLKVHPMATASIKGTLSAGSPPAGGRSEISIVETMSDGTVLSAASYVVNNPNNSFTFTAGVGSALVATQVDFSAVGVASTPTVNPPYLVVDPTPPAPPAPGPLTLEVLSVSP